MNCCNMRGFLSYLVLWILRKDRKNGVEIARELEKRRGAKPSPGTIYPALKALRQRGLVAEDRNGKYSLTKKGENELKGACGFFCRAFYDLDEMFKCCGKKPTG